METDIRKIVKIVSGAFFALGLLLSSGLGQSVAPQLVVAQCVEMPERCSEIVAAAVAGLPDLQKSDFLQTVLAGAADGAQAGDRLIKVAELKAVILGVQRALPLSVVPTAFFPDVVVEVVAGGEQDGRPSVAGAIAELIIATVKEELPVAAQESYLVLVVANLATKAQSGLFSAIQLSSIASVISATADGIEDESIAAQAQFISAAIETGGSIETSALGIKSSDN